MATVKLNNVSKVYNKSVVAVQNLSLEIKDKEFIVLVGPSGCGKSTTMRMVAGLEDITKGELYIDDQLVNNVEPKDRDIAMVFQHYALYPHMTAYENMAFGLRQRKEKQEVIDKKVNDAAAILGISHLLSRMPKALSGGERQRVAIGRAIVRQPKVFLMDEPLSSLDAKLRNQMRKEILKLRETIDTTFIYVTHDQTEAITLGDRIAIMKDGCIQQIGTADEVFNRPVNRFVAGFIGVPQMNFVPAELSLVNGNYAVRVFEREIILCDEMQKKLRQQRQCPCQINLGIRAEHIKAVPKDTPGSIKALLDVSEMMGSEVYMHVLVDQRDIVIRVQLGDLNRFVLQPGKKHYMNFIIPPKKIHLFDISTDRNLMPIR